MLSVVNEEGVPRPDLSEDNSLRQGVGVNLIPGHIGVCRIVHHEAAECLIGGPHIACLKDSSIPGDFRSHLTRFHGCETRSKAEYRSPGGGTFFLMVAKNPEKCAHGQIRHK